MPAPSNKSSRTASKARTKQDARHDPAQVYWRDVEDVAKHGVPPAAAAPRACDHPGCADMGAYRAPKSSGNLRDFYWFCLPHVQDYNKSWNFYSGFSIDDMEDVRRQDMVGWRPTWPLGKLGAGDRNKDISPDALRAHIFTQFFGGKAKARTGSGAAAATMADGLLPEERAALVTLGMPAKASWDEIKRRYKELALQHHPDLHQENAAEAAQAEMQIKLINRAYTVLKKRHARTALA